MGNEVGWVVVNDIGKFVTGTLARTATMAREQASDYWRGGWRHAYRKEGWRVVRVRIVREIENDR